MNIKKSTVATKTFKLLGTHAASALVCLVLLFMFSGVTSTKAGAVIFTTLVAFVIAINNYSLAWDIAKKDIRDVKIINNHIADGEKLKKVNPADGFYSSILLTVINLVLLVLYATFFNGAAKIKMITTIIFRAWQSPYIILLSRNQEANLAVGAVVSLLPMVLYSLGYFMGTKDMGRFDDLLFKLVYKNKKKNAK